MRSVQRLKLRVPSSLLLDWKNMFSRTDKLKLHKLPIAPEILSFAEILWSKIVFFFLKVDLLFYESPAHDGFNRSLTKFDPW